MYRNIFDSHAHYDSDRFAEDRAAVLESLPQHGIAAVMNAASDLASARDGAALAAAYPFVFCSAGVHPHEAEAVPDDYLQQLAELCRYERCRAVGEIGLDYHYDFSPRDIQQRVFDEQLGLAEELDMPVIIHSREATEDTLQLLRRHRVRGVVHCFSGSAEVARILLEMGFYIGFTGVVTFKNARRALEALQAVPDDRLLIETDCPYMAPEPRRGERCSSLLLPHVAEKMAEVRGTTAQQIFDLTCRNACTLYGLDPLALMK